MPFQVHRRVMALGAGIASMAAVHAAPLNVTVRLPPAPPAGDFRMGAAQRPDGATLGVAATGLLLDGRPWTPAMGEFHFTRYPAGEWRGELLRMKAGGIDIVATYVFWIHHEEVEGEFDWTGARNLREFVRLAGDAGLKVVVRCGPWCHGEVRNGGLPDWALGRKDWSPRTMDAGFLDRVRVLYGQIARQLHGLLWKDGGPVIGIQLDNEYRGPAEYLLALKRIAREAGLDVPLYTRTGWPALRTPMPFGEIVPLYGSYAEGFWDRELTAMPGTYWSKFRFSTKRLDENIASEQLGRREVADPPDEARYPFLTCEIGGGMASSYHRRLLIDPADVEATVLVKVGSGGMLPGYYMHHGGTNPDGRRTTLMEAQNTPGTNYNDLPVKDYDYQSPLGQYGQIRPHYHLLRRLHLFLHDFGAKLAAMPPVLPDEIPQGRDDVTTLRWAVRTDGTSGFVFVSHYERARHLVDKEGVQFSVRLPGRVLEFPAVPVTVPGGSRFFWPFNLDLGHGVTIAWATAQPLCLIDDGGGRTVFFGATAGVLAQFAVAGEASPRVVETGRGPAFRLRGADGAPVQIVVLAEADSLALWKGEWRGRERVFLTRAGLTIDGGEVRLVSPAIADLHVGIFPAPADLAGGEPDGVFARFTPPPPPAETPAVSVVEVQPAGPAREIPLGRASNPVAEQPGDADFARAAVWRIRLPDDLDMTTDPILRIRYAGDVARVTLDGVLLTDDFFHGAAWEIGLRRHAPGILKGDLRLAILPLRQDAVAGPARKIHLADELMPDFGGTAAVAQLKGVEIIPRYSVRLPTGEGRRSNPADVLKIGGLKSDGDAVTKDGHPILP
jgi:beta-galactosidase